MKLAEFAGASRQAVDGGSDGKDEDERPELDGGRGAKRARGVRDERSLDARVRAAAPDDAVAARPLPEEEVTTWLFEPESFAPLAKRTPDGKRFSIVTDYLGTPREMFDEAGKLA